MLVLPGHYMSWREANDQLAFISSLTETMLYDKDIYAIQDKAPFLHFIKSNMRQQPDEYAMIRL